MLEAAAVVGRMQDMFAFAFGAGAHVCILFTLHYFYPLIICGLSIEILLTF